jgi:hypothetical protein
LTSSLWLTTVEMTVSVMTLGIVVTRTVVPVTVAVEMTEKVVV